MDKKIKLNDPRSFIHSSVLISVRKFIWDSVKGSASVYIREFIRDSIEEFVWDSIANPVAIEISSKCNKK